MVTDTSVPPTPYFTDYCRLFCRLRSLVAAGRDENAEAESLRDDMDVLWRRLSSADLDRLDALAVDLSRVDTQRSDSGEVSSSLTDEFREILTRKDVDISLKFLRENEERLPPHDVAALRGILWAELGQHLPAAVFFSDAIRRRPEDTRMHALYFMSLLKAGEAELARSEALRMVSDTTDPYRFLLAADVLFETLRWEESSVPELELRRIIQLVGNGTKNLGRVAPNSWHAAIASSALYGRALGHEILGERSEAMAAAAEAERLRPPVTAQTVQGPAEENGRFRRHLQECRRMSQDAAVAQLGWQLACAA